MQPTPASPQLRVEDLQAEHDALLPGVTGSHNNLKTRRSVLSHVNWKAHPFWILPIVLLVNLCRGATSAPHIHVYRTIACRILYPTIDLPGVTANQIGPECSGPDVQARAARIQASVLTLTYVLSAMSTGVWSRLGDVHGRKPVILLFGLGAIGREVVQILVMDPTSIFGRHAEASILLGPIVEGLTGAIPLFDGAVHAYVADCTPHGSRSQLFSTVQGMVFVGAALGPWVSGMVLPSSTVLPVDVNNAFYLSISLMSALMLLVASLLPESRKRSSYETENPPQGRIRLPGPPAPAVLRQQFTHLVSVLLTPVTVFKPRKILGQPRRRTYNLTLVGASIFIFFVANGIQNVKYMYSQHVYDWTTRQLGYFMSFLWIVKAVHLLVCLPFAISYFKPKAPPNGGVSSAEHVAAELIFDTRLAQYSLGLDCIGDMLITLLPTSSQVSFVALASLSSFASGSVPALQSLGAVCLHACGLGSEVGTLFGGIAVVTSIGHIISPYSSAFTYGYTVGFFPKAIFMLAACLLGSIVLLLSGITARPEDISPSEVDVIDPSDDSQIVE